MSSFREYDRVKQLNSLEAHQPLHIGVIGLGYVGVPNAVTFAQAGHKVVGFDVNPMKVSEFRSNARKIAGLDLSEESDLFDSGRLSASLDPDVLAECDCIIICVPTPVIRKNGAVRPDLSFVKAACETVATILGEGQLVVLESTTHVGTTRGIVQQTLERTGLVAGKNFFLGYAPEREDPGNDEFRLQSIPRIVGGISEYCSDLTKAVYESAYQTVEVASSVETAELVKLHENTFRWVNIALVNELKHYCEAAGLNVWEIVRLAATKPFGFMPFTPGPGVGGHCIPVDPHYLEWSAASLGLRSHMVRAAATVNEEMPSVIAVKALNILNQQQTSQARVLMVGMSYKANVGDARESPASTIAGFLIGSGHQVDYVDPFIQTISIGGRETNSVPLSDLTEDSYSIGIICVDHKGIDYEEVLNACSWIIDTCNVFPFGTHKNVISA